MATSRPFTYNNGSTITRTEQIGDLAVGLLPQDYSSQPGGRVWWMGPDEDNRYIVGKDVPDMNWPTPVGNVGSVQFWGTSTKDDGEFIDLINDNFDQSFTTTQQCLNWLITEDYWTNYPGRFDGPLWNEVGIESFPSPQWSSTTLGADSLTINPTLGEIYVNVNGAGNTNGILNITNLNTSGSNYTITETAFTPPNYLPRASSPTTNIGAGESYLDVVNQKLYVNGFPGDSSIGGRIARYDVNSSTKDLETYISYTNTSANDQQGPIIGGDSKALIYTGTGYKVFSNHSTGNMFVSQSETVANSTTGDITHLGLNTNDSYLMILTSNRYRRLIDTADMSIIASNQDNAIESPALVPNQIVYVASNNRFYYRVNAATNSVQWGFTKGDGLIIVVNGSTNQIISKSTLGGGNGNQYTQSSGLVYDPNRDVIWSFNTKNYDRDDWELCALNITSNNIVKKVNIGGSNKGKMYIDSTNDFLYILGNNKTQVYNLGDIFPI